jgi:hypothetical protein
MIGTLEEIAQFLLDHAELINLIRQAIQAGQITNESLMASIKQSMVAGSDIAMKIELDP